MSMNAFVALHHNDGGVKYKYLTESVIDTSPSVSCAEVCWQDLFIW
jgi:hypothetical protein